MYLRELIANGLRNGVVSIKENPNDGDLACFIGEYWFYFLETKYLDMNTQTLLKSFSVDELTEMICTAIRELDKTERAYYRAYLQEHYKEDEVTDICVIKNPWLSHDVDFASYWRKDGTVTKLIAEADVFTKEEAANFVRNLTDIDYLLLPITPELIADAKIGLKNAYMHEIDALQLRKKKLQVQKKALMNKINKTESCLQEQIENRDKLAKKLSDLELQVNCDINKEQGEYNQ